MKILTTAIFLWGSAGTLLVESPSLPLHLLSAPQAASSADAGPPSIAFHLETPTPVRAHLYDAQGAMLRTLTLGLYAPGRHEVRWDGLDSSGRPVLPGAYLLEVHLGAKLIRSVANSPQL